VKSVGVVKDQGHGNDRYDNEKLCHIKSPSGTGGSVSVSTWQRRSNLAAEVNNRSRDRDVNLANVSLLNGQVNTLGTFFLTLVDRSHGRSTRRVPDRTS
jgi:hypothetical protein